MILKCKRIFSLVVVVCSVAICAGCGGRTSDVKVSATIIQTLARFNRPESCAFSLDGKHLFVANCASSPQGLREEQGAVSKLSVDSEGKLSMVSARFSEGLNGPLGMEVLPRETKNFPKGTLFVNVGMAWICDDSNELVTDHERLGTGVVAIDPQSGERLGDILLGSNSAVAKLLGWPVLGPNGLSFDQDGNMYVADMGNGGETLNPPVSGKPSIIMIEHGYIDALSEGKASGGVKAFVTAPQVPNGVRAEGDFVYYVTCDGEGPKGGAIFRVQRDTFGNSKPEVIMEDIGPMDGLVFMRDGSMIASRMSGDLVLVRPGKSFEVLDPGRNFNGPSDIKSRTLNDGTVIVVVPEQEMDAQEDWEQNLHVVQISNK